MLQLSWSDIGPGAALEQFCAELQDELWPQNFDPFPLPMPGKLAFSYASLHSHLERYLFKSGGIGNMSVPNKKAIANAFQSAAIDQLEEKLVLAFQWCKQENIKIGHLVVSGGVASNSQLRNRQVSLCQIPNLSLSRLATCMSSVQEKQISLIFPPPSLCTGGFSVA